MFELFIVFLLLLTWGGSFIVFVILRSDASTLKKRVWNSERKIMQLNDQIRSQKEYLDYLNKMVKGPAEPVGTRPAEPVGTRPVEPVSTRPMEPVATRPMEPVVTRPVEPVISKPSGAILNATNNIEAVKSIQNAVSNPTITVPLEPLDPVTVSQNNAARPTDTYHSTRVKEVEHLPNIPSINGKNTERVETKVKNTPTKRKFEILSVESIISKLGIFLLLMGIGFIFVWAYERAYPVLATSVGTLLGFIFMFLAFRVEKKHRIVLSQVLLGGSIATFYITIYSIYKGFDLLSVLVTFIIMIVITGLAFLLSVSKDSQALAIIGILGGLLTPFMVPMNQIGMVGIGIYIGMITSGCMAIYYKKKWRSLQVSIVFGLLVVLTLIINFSQIDFTRLESYQLFTLLMVLLLIVNGTDYLMVYLKKAKSQFKWMSYAIFVIMPLYTLLQISQFLTIKDIEQFMICSIVGVIYLVLGYVFWKKEENVVSNIQMSLSSIFFLYAIIVFFAPEWRGMLIILLCIGLYVIAHQFKHRFVAILGHIIFVMGVLFTYGDLLGKLVGDIGQINFSDEIPFIIVRIATAGLMVIAGLLNKAWIRKTMIIYGLDVYFFLAVIAYISRIDSIQMSIAAGGVGVLYLVLAVVFWKKGENLIGNIHISLSSLLFMIGIINYSRDEWRVMIIILLSVMLYLIAVRAKNKFVFWVGHIVILTGYIFGFVVLFNESALLSSRNNFLDGLQIMIVYLSVTTLVVIAGMLNTNIIRKVITIIGINIYIFLAFMIYANQFVSDEKYILTGVFSMVYLVLAYWYWKQDEILLSNIQMYFSGWFMIYSIVGYFTGELRMLMSILICVLFYWIAYQFKSKSVSVIGHILFGVWVVIAFMNLFGQDPISFEIDYFDFAMRMIAAILLIIAAKLNGKWIRSIIAVVGLDIYLLIAFTTFVVQLWDPQEPFSLILITYGIYFGLLYLLNKKIKLLPEPSFVIMLIIPFAVKVFMTQLYLITQSVELWQVVSFLGYGIYIYLLGHFVYKVNHVFVRYLYKWLFYGLLIVTLLVDLSVYAKQVSYGVLGFIGLVYLIQYFEPDRERLVFTKTLNILRISWLAIVGIYLLLMNYGLAFNILVFMSDIVLLILLFLQLKQFTNAKNLLWMTMLHTLGFVLVVGKAFAVSFDNGVIMTLFLAAYAIGVLVISVIKLEKTLAKYALICILIVAAKLILFDLRQLDIIFKIISSMLFGGALLILSYVLQPVLAKQNLSHEEV